MCSFSLGGRKLLWKGCEENYAHDSVIIKKTTYLKFSASGVLGRQKIAQVRRLSWGAIAGEGPSSEETPAHESIYGCEI